MKHDEIIRMAQEAGIDMSPAMKPEDALEIAYMLGVKTEREVSDKLEKALEEIDEHPPFGGTRQAYIAWLRSVATKALAEVAAIRARTTANEGG